MVMVDLRHTHLKPVSQPGKHYCISSINTPILTLLDDSGYYGVNVKHVERQNLENKNQLKKGERKSLRVVTCINKYEIWFPTMSKRDTFMEELFKMISILEGLQDKNKAGKMKFGSEESNKKRSWAKKKTATGKEVTFAVKTRAKSSSLSNKHGESTNDALSRLEAKYSVGN